MLRLPAVAGSFYPSNPAELSTQIAKYLEREVKTAPARVRACLVPHAGYVYSGHVAGAVLTGIRIPKKIVILGVRHRPPGSPAAIISSGAWRTPLGDADIDEELASTLLAACPELQEDQLAHSREHSLEVQIPFLQVLEPQFRFVPIALGSVHFESLMIVGEAIGQVLGAETEEVLLLTTSDLNHYEDDATTRRKDRLAIEQLLKMDAKGLYDTCRSEDISMCGLGPAVAMLTALRVLKASRTELVRYATSADRSGDLKAVVGYAGMIFS
ncbi:MAG: AmmeMemoRadiSam system protein B [Acidobacteriota bacterium]|nr:AmmeMemoRadiSam system protein B [Acidobacteriota bacterium]